MELRRHLAILRRRWLLIALTVLTACAASYITTDRADRYTAEATVYIGASRFSFDAEAGNVSADRAVGLDRLISTYATMIDSQPVAEEAIAGTGGSRSVEAVLAQTEAFGVPGTNLLRIRVVDGDPAVAQGLANAIADAFVSKLGEIEPGRPVGEGEVPFIPAAVFERARLPTVPAPIQLRHNMIVAALFGFVLAGAAAILVEYLDVTVKSVEDAERRTDLPVLGVIPLQEHGIAMPARLRERSGDPAFSATAGG